MRSQIKAMYLIVAVLAAGCSSTNSRTKTRFNDRAALAGALPDSPLQWKVITTWIDTETSTASTLYGNDIAVAYARANSGSDYPSGSVLSLVTWSQQEDERWFGAKIPAATKLVEFLAIGKAADGRSSYSYKEFAGAPLQNISSSDGSAPNARSAFLLSQPAAFMP